MAVTNRNELNLNIITAGENGPAQPTSETLTDKSVKPLKVIFFLETIFGIQRLSVFGSVLGPPSPVSQLYGVTLMCMTVLFIYSKIISGLNILNQPESERTENYLVNIYEAVTSIPYVIVLFNTILIDSSKTARLFEIFQDIDKEMHIPEKHEIFKMSRHKTIAVSIVITISQVFVFLGMIQHYNTQPEDLLMTAATGLIELELCICYLLLGYVEMHIRYMTAHVRQKFSLARDTSNENLLARFLQQPSFEISSETKTFDVDIFNLYKLYDKILDSFNLIKYLFKLQVFLFLALNYVNVMLSIFKIILVAINKDTLSGGYYLAIVLWWARLATIVLLPCFQCEHINLAVQDLKDALVDLLADLRQKRYHRTARALLGYLDVTRPRFDVYHLFHLDLSLPYNFASLLVTYLVVIVQFKYL